MKTPNWRPIKKECSRPEYHKIISREGRPYCIKCQYFLSIEVFSGGGFIGEVSGLKVFEGYPHIEPMTKKDL